MKDAPHPRSVAEVVDLVPLEIKTALMPVLVDAYAVTAAQARRKEHLLRLASLSPWWKRVAALIGKTIRG